MIDPPQPAGQPALIGLAEARAAQQRIHPRVHRTPTLSATTLGELFGVRLQLKAELFQRTGSFKPRGVFNKLLTLPAADLERGLVSLSAGNHAAALAYGATALGSHATIVMPATALATKVAATRAYRGEVVLTADDLLDVCQQIQHERNLVLVHPFDDPMVIAGQATVGLELLEDLAELDAVLVPVGGGGLISGIAAVVKAERPQVTVIGVEPVGANAMTRSLAQGSPVRLDRLDTIADGLAAPFAGAHTLRHVQAFVDEMVMVEDQAIADALRLIMQRCKLAAEPSGAAGIAALLSGAVELPAGARVLAVISGGNADPAVLKRLL
ncbi:MAG: threonine/serine dehydratase [Sporichthyaceae bacterium]|nr:threonine/serine dehydratase [Sporichthyaceae bacterium]